jgi:hypothetical protein
MRAPVFGLSTTPVMEIKSELRLQLERDMLTLVYRARWLGFPRSDGSRALAKHIRLSFPPPLQLRTSPLRRLHRCSSVSRCPATRSSPLRRAPHSRVDHDPRHVLVPGCGLPARGALALVALPEGAKDP